MGQYEGISASDLELLSKYDTPTICNVIELFDIRPRDQGYMDQRITACFPQMPPMVGYASTATFRSASPPKSGDIYSSMSDQVESFTELPRPAVVVFQDIDDPPAAASFGEVMCTTYQAFGAAGLITSGGGRDLDQVEAIGFPTFVGGVMCAHGYCHTLNVNVPVHVGGMTIYPGDLIHGDRNGVTTVPAAIASQVAHVCKEFMEAEDIVLNYVRSENPTPKGMAQAREACGQKIAELRDRVLS